MSLDLRIYELIYLFASFQGVLLAGFILFKRYTRENVFLFLLVLLFSFYLLENVIWSSGYIREIPHLFFTTLPLIYLIGPLFFIYIRTSLTTSSIAWKDLLHLSPFLFEVIILIPFYLLDGETKIRIYEMSQQSTNGTKQISIYFIGYLIYLVSTFFYFFKSLQLIRSASENGMKAKEWKKFKALRIVSVGFFIYIAFSLILSGLSWTDLEVKMLAFHVNLICLTFLIHSIGFIAFSNPVLLQSLTKSSDYQFSTLSPEKKKALSNTLLELMNNQKLYLKSYVTASHISEELSITNHELSQLLNVELNTSFYDLINQYRIEHAKNILLSKEYRDAKILHVALDSGFSNKSSFLRNFKKSTQLTPTAFKKLHENQVPIN